MAFCTKCGYKLAEGDKFCFECGTRVDVANMPNKTTSSAFEEAQPSAYVERKQEYAGKIIKCPACGAELPSFAAICPDCGHEINSQNISPYIRKFSNCIDEYDHAIANDPEPPKAGWKTWSKNKRILWVILNICTVFIPWVIYLAYPLIKPFVFPKSVPVLSANEKQKAALIENATFPNEREATIEAMMFTKSKMAFLATEKFNKKTQYWTNLWNTKAEQLNQRANIILKGDKIVETTYADIVSIKNKVDKHVRMQAIIGTVIIVAYLIFIAVIGFSSEGASNVVSGRDSFEWLNTGLCTKVPEIDSNDGHYWSNSDTELNVRVENISLTQFEEYITACKEMGYTIEAKKDTSGYTAYNAAGYYLDLQYWGSSGKKGPLDIKLLAPLTGDISFTWPTGALADVIPRVEFTSGKLGINNGEELEISLYEFTKEAFDAYVQQCKVAGFNIDSEEDHAEIWYRYEAYNNEGYRIRISVNNMKELTINMRAPRKKDAISWPTTGLASMLPKPDNCIGEVSIDFDWSFSVYISDMTIDDFNAYVEECINSGFEKSTRTDHYFSADMGEDISITIEYVGFNTVYISISDLSKL